MAFGSYTRRYHPVRTTYDWFSRDTGIVGAYAADPLCNYIFTASGFYDLARILEEISRKSWYSAVPKALPVLLFSGAMDPVGNYGKGPNEVYRRLKKAGVQDVTLQLFPEGRHEMLNETNRREVYQLVLDWINEILQSNSL